MSARKSGLQASAFSLGSNNLLAYLTSFSFGVDSTLVNGAGIADTNEVNIWAGGKGTFTAKVNYSASSAAASNLAISAYSIGGSSYLGDLRSGSMKFSNPSQEGKGIADKFAYPNAVGGRSVEMSGTHLISSATLLHALMSKAASETVSDKSIAFTMTIGSETYTCNMVIASCTHKGERGGLYEVDLSAKGTAAPSAPTGTTIYGEAITGDAVIGLTFDTEAGQYGTSGSPLSCFMSGLDISYSDGAIIETSVTLEVQGTPTVTTSS